MEQKGNQEIRELARRHHLLVVEVEKEVGKNPDRYADFVHFTDSGAAMAATR